VPSAWSSAAWNGAGSICANTSPWRTSWPSVNRTAFSWPVTREITETVASGVTVPSAVTVIGTSPSVAVAVPTVMVGRLRPPAAPLALAPPAHRARSSPIPIATATTSTMPTSVRQVRLGRAGR
jgi:hypothetical protein